MRLRYAGYHFHRPKAHLRVGGEDAMTFLQGQFTNQLQRPPGSVVYGLWLNQKGKVLADSFLAKREENEFLLMSFGSAAATIQERLEAYIIADDVTIADETSQVAGLTILGEGSEAMVSQLLGVCPASGQWVRRDGLMAFRGRRSEGENYEIIGPVEIVTAMKAQLTGLGLAELSEEDIARMRIESGIPSVPEDIGPGDLPNEGALEEVAISYTKGCYLGQEVMARLKNLGQVRRKLHVVRGVGEVLPVASAPLFQGTEKVGELRSVAKCGDGFVAMAMLSLVKLDRGVGLSLAPGAVTTVELVTHG